MSRLWLGLLSGLFFFPALKAQEIGFPEEFALSKDRGKTLQSLIPSTEDYYFYTALHRLNSEQYDQAAALFDPWLKTFGQTNRLTELQWRHALQTHDRDPKKAYDFVIRNYGLSFHHQPIVSGVSPNLPTALNPNGIARTTLKAKAIAQRNLVNPFEDSALDWLGLEPITDVNFRRNFLQRLTKPDLPTLPKLIADDLASENAGPFGSIGIHHNLTSAQLDELESLRRDLKNQGHFVNMRLLRLQPGADENWRRDPAKTLAYFDRLERYALTLDAVHNQLKAHILFHRLTLDRNRGVFDKDRFLKYLALPRGQGYMSIKMLESVSQQRYAANLNADYTSLTLLPPIRTDEPLVREYLKHFFKEADSPKEFEAFINDGYLARLFAETKIELGLGEPEKWAAQLPPEQYAALKDRIDIDFAPTNQNQFTADEAVSLTLAIKNVPTLIVKIFEINTVNYFREFQREIETDINLDGLVPNAERTVKLTDAPVRRLERKFDFPELTKPGVYIVDFIGGGKSSRALIRKGTLRPLVRSSSAGQSLTIVDDANKPVPTATVWFGGMEYTPENDGTILIPFGSAPGRFPIVIRNGDVASLDFLSHEAESYSLQAGIHIDREQLLSQRLATLAIRPGLFLNGKPTSLTILEQPKLFITAVDHDGVATNSEIAIEKLFEDRETTHQFRVPPRLSSLTVRFEVKVKSLTTAQMITLSASKTFTANGIAKSDRIEDVHLARFGGLYALELLGRTGEIKADRPLNISIKHRDFKEPVSVQLKTDANGRTMLGELVDISSITVTCPDGQTSHTWNLPLDRCTYRQVIHVKSGDAMTIPYVGSAKEISRRDFTFFRVIGTTIVDDLLSELSLKDGSITIKGQPAGDYDLSIKQTNETIRIRVVEGPVVSGYLLGSLRHLEVNPLKPVRIAGIKADGDEVVISLADVSKYARVHVYASRYAPSESAFGHFSKVHANELRGVMPGTNESSYLTGRNIGDEYRYVLDRRLQKTYPGNMLDRPQLLLNPWAIRQTEAGEQLAQAGDSFGTTGSPKPAAPFAELGAKMDSSGKMAGPAGAFAELDFLGESAVSLLNLIPEADGTVKIRKAAFGSKAWITVVAVDPLHTAVTSLALPESKATTYDLRLRAGLDPKGHFTQQKQVTVLEAGKPFVLADAAGSRFEAYDSLAKLHALYATLTKDPRMSEFAFVLKWPTLKIDEKQTLYSKHACHELNFFLFKKDRPFFDTVIKPYLANKKDKTFLDHFLLSADLSEYLKPWQYARLNTVEKILLARVLPNEAAKTARFLADQQKLLPPNLQQEQSLFEYAVKGSELAVLTELSLNRERLVERNFDMTKSTLPAINGPGGTPMAPSGGGGGFGGGMPTPGPTGAMGGRGGAPGSGGQFGFASKGSPARDGMARREMAEKQFEKSVLKMDDESKDVAKVAAASPADKAEQFFGEDRKKLKEAIMLYRKVDPTSEWAENNYDKLPIQSQLAGLVNVNPFWIDFANFKGEEAFLSKFVNRPGNNFTEAMFALALTQLPFQAAKHDIKFDGGKMTFTPAGPVIAFHEEVKPVGEVAGNLPILVSQNVYKHGDRYREENGERLDKFVSDEFVVHTVYGLQVVVTNPSPSRQRLAVLVQIPTGSLPLANAQPTKTVLLDLEPYRTGTIDVLFYFPAPGTFPHFPVHVARNETPVAAAKAMTFTVVAKPTKEDKSSWEYVSQRGSTDEVIAYLTRENVLALNLEMIAWRMNDAESFNRIIAVLTERHIYQPTLWTYAIKHQNLEAARELLKHLKPPVGGGLQSTLVNFDPVITHDYEHLEYKPLVNARAHALGKQRQIVNARVFQHYSQFIHLLQYRKSLTDEDKLAAVHYLLLQDRIDDAGKLFDEVSREKVATKLQYDQCTTYLAMSREDYAKARTVAMQYANYPVDRWKKAFRAVIETLDEAEGKGPAVAEADDRNQQQARAAAKEPSFEFTLDNQQIKLTYQNVGEVTVNYYLLDVELLFSRNPFVQKTGGQFSTIRPNATKVFKLAGDATMQSIALPDEFKTKNVLVEVTAAGKRQSLPYYANAMTVTAIENFGQVKVLNAKTGKPLSKVYVKTYVRTQDGQVKFHKDGYTDIRGRFDYATVSTPERSGPAKYAVLILSDEFGAVIKEASPPQQ